MHRRDSAAGVVAPGIAVLCMWTFISTWIAGLHFLHPFTFALAIVSMVSMGVWTLLITGRLCLRMIYSSFLMVVNCLIRRSKGSLIVQGPFVLELDALLV